MKNPTQAPQEKLINLVPRHSEVNSELVERFINPNYSSFTKRRDGMNENTQIAVAESPSHSVGCLILIGFKLKGGYRPVSIEEQE